MITGIIYRQLPRSKAFHEVVYFCCNNFSEGFPFSFFFVWYLASEKKIIELRFFACIDELIVQLFLVVHIERHLITIIYFAVHVTYK